MQENEIWIDIEGYEGLYQVSNYGNVRSLNYKRTGKSKILKQQKHKSGYLKVNLYINGSMRTYLVHRLVCEAFIDNPENKPEVNHVDGNKGNNAIDNLEWTTRSENQIHAWNNGLKENTRSVVKQSLFLAQDACKRSVKCITTNIIYESISEAELLTGICHQNIGKCCNGSRKSAGKLPDGTKLEWEYLDE